MIAVSITFTGLEDILSMVNPAKVGIAIGEGIDRASQLVRDGVKDMPPVSAKTTGYGPEGVPVDTGRLRQSVRATKTALFGAEIDAPVDYADYVHEGTSKMPARPFFEWFLDDFGGTKMIEDTMEQALQKAVL